MNILLLSNPLDAAVYHFSSTIGDDSRTFIEASNMETPWKSLSKLNEIFYQLKPGDSILLKNGEVYEGFIHLSASGINGKPITIAGYGEGHLAIISGWHHVEKWTQSERKGIWRAEIGGQNRINLVEINGTNAEKGKYPNNGMLVYNVSNGNVITVNDNINPLEWKSASLAMRKNQWIIDRVDPEEYTNSGFIINQKMTYPPVGGYGLIIQDHINTLDINGEWHHDSIHEFLYVYLKHPPGDSIQIRYSKLENLLTNEGGVRHIRLSGLCFTGSNGSTINISSAFDIGISESVIENSGEDAVHVLDTPNFRFTKNKVRFALNNGIFLRYGTPNSEISDNEISDIHPFFGRGKSGDGNGIGICNISDFGTINRNKLSRIGYSGIVFGGIQTEVIQNHIHTFCMIKNDGGGIYTYEGKNNKPSFLRIVKENIIENGLGTISGTRHSSKIGSPQVEGIYLDDNASGILVEGNTIINMRRNGIHIHNGRKITLKGNLIANCQNQLALSDDNLGDPISDIKIIGNTFASFYDHQNLVTISSNAENFSTMSNIINNTFVFPKSSQLQFLIRKEKENRNFDLHFHTADELLHHGIIMEQSNLSPIPESGRTIVRKQAEKFDVEPDSFRDFCPNCKVIKGDLETKVSYTAAHATATIDAPPFIADNTYNISFEATVESQTTLHLQLRLNSNPWTNLSILTPIRLSVGTHTYHVTLNSVESTDKAVILLTAQEGSAAVVFRQFSITPSDIVPPLSTPQVVYNTTLDVISIPSTSNSIVPGMSILQPYQSAIVY